MARHVRQPWDLIVLSDDLLAGVGAQANRQLLRKSAIPVLVISDQKKFEALYTSRNIGARGLVFSQSGLNEIYSATNKILSGGTHWPHIGNESPLNGLHTSQSKTLMSPQLTDRQIEVLQYLKEGLTNKQISHRLNVTESTVKSHMSALFRKYNVSTRTKLVSSL